MLEAGLSGEANADAIVRTVHCTKKTVRDLSGTVIDFQKLELIGDGPRNIPNDLAQKLQVWKKFREFECSATGIIECLKLWVRGWDPAKWNGMLNVECVRDSTIDFIRIVMKGFMGAARALSCDQSMRRSGWKWRPEFFWNCLPSTPQGHTPTLSCHFHPRPRPGRAMHFQLWPHPRKERTGSPPKWMISRQE